MSLKDGFIETVSKHSDFDFKCFKIFESRSQMFQKQVSNYSNLGVENTFSFCFALNI